jgi:hypothetical protein
MRQKYRFNSFRDEDGIALVVSIAVLTASGALGAAAAAAAITADHQALRDRSAKQAVAAADAGAEIAVYRLNKFAETLDAAQPCVVRNGSTAVLEAAATDADGWCPEEGEDLGEGSSFTYRVSPPQQATVGGQDVWQRKTAASGNVNGVSRRTITVVNAASGVPLFPFTVFSDEDLTMRNNTLVDGNVRSNGNVVLQNAAEICGNITVGPGRELRGTRTCPGSTSSATEPLVLAPVTLPGSDDNFRLTVGGQGPDDPRSGTVWDPSTRVLALGNGDSITLNGDVYVVCGISLNQTGTIVIPDDGTPVKIYVDAPESCPGASPRGSVTLQQSATFDNESGDPTMLQLYVSGSNDPAFPTEITYQNLHDVQMVLYAPNSSVIFDNNQKYRGALMAKRVDMRNHAGIDQDARTQTLYGGDVPLPVYRRQSWVECPPATAGGEPDDGC